MTLATCQACPLYQTATYAVPGDGRAPCDWMLVGEAPGATEDKAGIPFVGDAGRLLDELLHLAGKTRADVYVTNVVRHRPPGNRTPTIAEQRACRPWLDAELAAVQPKVILTLGDTAMKAFGIDGKVTKIHGIPRVIEGRVVVPMLHPAYGLHDPRQMDLVREAWARLPERLANAKDTGQLPRTGQAPARFSNGVLVAGTLAIDTEYLPDGTLHCLTAWSPEAAWGGQVLIARPGEVQKVLCGTLVMHNAKADLPVLAGAGVRLEYTRLADTMVAAYLLGEDRLGLKLLAPRYLGVTLNELGPALDQAQDGLIDRWLAYVPEELLTGKTRGQRVKSAVKLLAEPGKLKALNSREWLRDAAVERFGPIPEATVADVPWEWLREYAGADAWATGKLWEQFEPLLDSYSMTNLFWDIEMPLVPILIDMERTGMAFDRTAAMELREELQALRNTALTELFREVGYEFNPNSPKELCDALLLAGVSLTVRTESGTLSTDKKTLSQLSEHPAVQRLFRVRETEKLLGTYVEAGLRQSERDGRVHGRFNQVKAGISENDAEGATGTGRLSSSDPNLQNIPVRTEAGRKIRQCYAATTGMTLVSVDYSQIEPRILTLMSGDEGLYAAFRSGESVYAYVAKILYPTLGSVAKNSPPYNLTKILVLGTNYGLTSFGVMRRAKMIEGAEIDITQEEAEQLIARYFARFPGIPDYMERTKEFAREHGYVATMYGRRRWLPDINSEDWKLRGRAERQAINAPIQGTAADIMKLATHRVGRAVGRYEARLLAPVHDEVVLECPDARVQDCVEDVKQVMLEAARDLQEVGVEVHVSLGRNWGEMQEVA